MIAAQIGWSGFEPDFAQDHDSSCSHKSAICKPDDTSTVVQDTDKANAHTNHFSDVVHDADADGIPSTIPNIDAPNYSEKLVPAKETTPFVNFSSRDISLAHGNKHNIRSTEKKNLEKVSPIQDSGEQEDNGSIVTSFTQRFSSFFTNAFRSPGSNANNAQVPVSAHSSVSASTNVPSTPGSTLQEGLASFEVDLSQKIANLVPMLAACLQQSVNNEQATPASVPDETHSSAYHQRNSTPHVPTSRSTPKTPGVTTPRSGYDIRRDSSFKLLSDVLSPIPGAPVPGAPLLERLRRDSQERILSLPPSRGGGHTEGKPSQVVEHTINALWTHLRLEGRTCEQGSIDVCDGGSVCVCVCVAMCSALVSVDGSRDRAWFTASNS